MMTGGLSIHGSRDDEKPRSATPCPVPESVQLLPYHGQKTVVLCRWGPGEAEQCRMCPKQKCIAYRDACLLRVPGRITEEEVLRRSALGLRWADREA